MEYYFSKTLTTSFEEAIQIIDEALKKESFGVVTQINMHEKLKEKLNVDFKRYTILGACNPPVAYQALLAEDKVGAMLPCNILVIEQGVGNIEVVAVNPVASLMAISNPALVDILTPVPAKLKNVIDNL